MQKKQSFIQLLDWFTQKVKEESKKGGTLSKNTIMKLCSLRGLMAVLCPETDGLQLKDRIKRYPKGNTRKEQAESILNTAYDEFPEYTNNGKEFITQRSARMISQIYWFEGFSQKEVYRILRREKNKNYI